jgi:hypothetical protein
VGFLSTVEYFLNIDQDIRDLNKNVLRFAMSEVILTLPTNALCTPLFMYHNSIIMPVCIRTACHML